MRIREEQGRRKDENVLHCNVMITQPPLCVSRKKKTPLLLLGMQASKQGGGEKGFWTSSSSSKSALRPSCIRDMYIVTQQQFLCCDAKAMRCNTTGRY